MDSNVIEIRSGNRKFGFKNKTHLKWYPRGSEKHGMLLQVNRTGEIKKNNIRFLPDTATTSIQQLSRIDALSEYATVIQGEADGAVIFLTNYSDKHYFKNNVWVMTEIYLHGKLHLRIKKTHINR